MATLPGGPPASVASLAPASPLVFAGSAERDVAFAKAFWNSVTLQPPLESRLGPGGPRPRETQRKAAIQLPPVKNESEQIFLEALKAQKAEEKEKYLQKAKRRDEILVLLWKQREERITSDIQQKQKALEQEDFLYDERHSLPTEVMDQVQNRERTDFLSA